MDPINDGNYADAQIIFYKSNKITGANMSWPVYEGRIPAWQNKDISEFIEHLKENK